MTMTMTRRRLSFSIAMLTMCALAGCASAPAADVGDVPTPRETAARAAPSVVPGGCDCGTEPGCPPCPVPSATASAPAPSPASGAFPPKAFAPPVERTKKAGDGQWTPLAVHRSSGPSSPLYTTLVRPHKVRDFVVVQIVAIDTSQVSIDMVLGTDEPAGTSFPKEKRPGLVAASMHKDLIAVTNGGFMSRHGGHGLGFRSETVLSPTDAFCTFAKLNDGRHLIGTHASISGELGAGYAFFRQTPPCLIERGVKHADLANEHKAKKWGGAEDGNKEIRRSAVGLGPDPRVLYFAIGDYLTAEWLADGLVAAGVTDAAQLDINYNYTRFIVYERAGGGALVATSPLLKELKAPRKEYLTAASGRDFFTLQWIAPGP